MAEDDPIVRRFTRRALEMNGYKVLEAEDGECALRLSAGHPETIHLLLTDMLMPGMNGRELADRFRSERPQTPVVFMSGYTDEVIVDQGLLEAGALFIQKPFSPAILIDLIQSVLEPKPELRN